jgi:hypothetical protein
MTTALDWQLPVARPTAARQQPTPTPTNHPPTRPTRVFLGNGQYFVSSDVGGGKMQWYGFHKEPAGGDDAEGRRKERLLEIFGHWTDDVVDLIKATPEVGFWFLVGRWRALVWFREGRCGMCAIGEEAGERASRTTNPNTHPTRKQQHLNPNRTTSCAATSTTAPRSSSGTRAASRCWATRRTRCSPTWGRAAAWRSRTRSRWRRS